MHPASLTIRLAQRHPMSPHPHPTLQLQTAPCSAFYICAELVIFKNSPRRRACKVTQQVKAFDTKPSYLSSVPGAHMVEGSGHLTSTCILVRVLLL